MPESKSSGHHKSPGPAHSKAQWRFLFATHKPFAHKWAEQVVAERGKKTGFRALPERKGARKR